MSFFAELKRRNVVKVGIAYAVSTWVLLQITDIVAEILILPEWAPKLILLILIIGFIPALIFAWAFELTPEGVKREKDVDRNESIAPKTGKKLNATIGSLLIIALAYIAYDKLVIDASYDSEPVANEETNNAEIAAKVEVETPTVAEIQKSIVVLPFVNMSNDPDQEFFSDGLSEELLNVRPRSKTLGSFHVPPPLRSKVKMPPSRKLPRYSMSATYSKAVCAAPVTISGLRHS